MLVPSEDNKQTSLPIIKTEIIDLLYAGQTCLPNGKFWLSNYDEISKYIENHKLNRQFYEDFLLRMICKLYKYNLNDHYEYIMRYFYAFVTGLPVDMELYDKKHNTDYSAKLKVLKKFFTDTAWYINTQFNEGTSCSVTKQTIQVVESQNRCLIM